MLLFLSVFGYPTKCSLDALSNLPKKKWELYLTSRIYKLVLKYVMKIIEGYIRQLVHWKYWMQIKYLQNIEEGAPYLTMCYLPTSCSAGLNFS